MFGVTQGAIWAGLPMTLLPGHSPAGGIVKLQTAPGFGRGLAQIAAGGGDLMGQSGGEGLALGRFLLSAPTGNTSQA